MTCSICEGRKAKRFCPAVRSEICPLCCGKEREESLDCPLDCPYLVESRQYEKRPGLRPEDFPYPEIRIRDTYLREREELLTAAGQFLLDAAFKTPGAVDRDVRDALESMARTYKSLESGVIYQSMPNSPVGQAIVGQVREMLDKFRQGETQRAGFARTRDVDVLGILVFLLRMAIDRDNGRRRGRSFLDFLRSHFTPVQPAPAQPSLILPG